MRLLTWNTFWCFGPWRARQPLLAEALRRREPDVVLLQETWPEQAEALAAACGLDVIDYVGGRFVPKVQARLVEEVAGEHFGNAVLGNGANTVPLGQRPLDSPDDVAPRCGIAAKHTDAAGTDWHVVATHLCSRVDAGPTRAKQLDELRVWADVLTAELPGPLLLGGDLNQVPTSDEYRAAVEPHWVDLWPQVHPDDPGSTMVVDNPRLRSTEWMVERNPPGAPSGVRFDYLLERRNDTDPDGSFRPAVVVEEMALVGDHDDEWPSDHLGLVADLRTASGRRSG